MPEFSLAGFGGLRLAGERWGDEEDPAIVVLHGGGQSRRAWRTVARALAEAGRHVVSVDLRGHGESEWAPEGHYGLDAHVGDLRAVLASLPSRPVVLGSSLGGLVALAALGEGERAAASGLILVDASPWLTDDARALGRFMHQHAAGFETLSAAAEALAALTPNRRLAMSDDDDGPAEVERLLTRKADGRLHWRWDPNFLDGLRLAEAEDRLQAAATRIGVPTLIVRGSDSRLVGADEATRLQALIAGAEQIDIDGAGHLVGAEQTDALNAAIVEFLERRIPREPVLYEAGSDPRTLRDALGCFGTGVTVVTTRDAGGAPIGLTANSFTSVSLDPPLILFCLAKSSANLATFEAAGHFAVNVLHIGQQPTSNRFARKDADRFEATPWSTWTTDVPILDGSLATFECDRHQVVDAGDHLVFIGLVVRARFEPQRDPLIYFRGRYQRLHFS